MSCYVVQFHADHSQKIFEKSVVLFLSEIAALLNHCRKFVQIRINAL